MVDLLIRGGQVVTPSGVGNWEVAVQDEKIVAVAAPGTTSSEGAKVIDATGKIVVPGGVEPHAHIGGPRQPDRMGADPVSKAAIYGGTTTVCDFATQIPDHDLHHALGGGGRAVEGQCIHRLRLPSHLHQRRYARAHRPRSLSWSRTGSPLSRSSLPASARRVRSCKTTTPTSGAWPPSWSRSVPAAVCCWSTRKTRRWCTTTTPAPRSGASGTGGTCTSSIATSPRTCPSGA